jgi:hypothetical protein
MPCTPKFGGIENGLHQRLDVSHNDDRCRIRHPYAMFVAGLFRRISRLGRAFRYQRQSW